MRCIVSALVLFLVAAGTGAQTPPPQHQHHVDSTIIDGSKNPELIPDSEVYRLWLVMISVPPNAPPQKVAFQQAHMKDVRLSGEDSLQLLPILADFNKQYTALLAAHNQAERAALLGSTPPVDENAFLKQRDDLVSATRATIAERLTQSGMTRLNTFIQEQKHHVRIHTTAKGAQQ